MATDKRNYNVFFNTHTVSGIVISIGLFVCFFAGAFALFLDEINHWEANAQRAPYQMEIDYERLLDIAETEGYTMEGRDLFMRYRDGARPYLQISGQALAAPAQDSSQTEEETVLSTEDSLAQAFFFLMVDNETYELKAKEFDSDTKELGTFLYHLHYFQQIPAIGIYLAGLVSLFFAFAILTGVIVHWKKITSNFFTFRLKGSIKNLWTDSHTALGIIGLPFQFMYAVSGAFFGLIILLFIPFMMVLFDGDQEKMLDLFRGQSATIDAPIIADAGEISINSLVDGTLTEFRPSDIEYITVQLKDYQTDDAELTVTTQLDGEKAFMALTTTTFRLSDGAVIGHKALDENRYVDVAPLTLGRLHFAQYGGYLIKAIYFIMALITCYVIMSGVMIWLTARDKKMYEHKAKFNRNVGAIYTGASLGLFPAIALFFCMVKIFPLEMADRYDYMTTIFFSFWLAYIIYGYFVKSTYTINKHALYLAGGMGILIPILNGMQSGLWLWKSAQMGYIDSLLIDVSWLVMGIVSILSAIYAKPVVNVKKVRKPAAERKTSNGTSTAPRLPKKPLKPTEARPKVPNMVSKSSKVEAQ